MTEQDRQFLNDLSKSLTDKLNQALLYYAEIGGTVAVKCYYTAYDSTIKNVLIKSIDII